MIEQVFDLTITEGDGYFRKLHVHRPAWVLVPCAAYVPSAKSSYELRNEVLTPMIFQQKSDVQGICLLLDERSMLLKPDQELGVNATVVVGWDNGVVVTRELEVYDGAPKLRKLNKKTVEKFNVLATGNSYHFYAKGRAKLEDVQSQVDDDWLTFRRMGAGYIRVTSNAKSPIVRAELHSMDPDHGF
jgi:hypothetical protein